jgi:hypothetical protein
MFTAHTAEIDDVAQAASEILEQIDVKKLSANSVGIVFCHFEFIEAGLLKELCGRLPFEVIGMTTMSGVSGGEIDAFQIHLAVLSADDVSFSLAVSAPLTAGTAREALVAAYGAARGKLPGDPAFIISFFPFLSDLSSADVLKSLDAVCGGKPIWGSVCSDMDMSYSNAMTIHNGQEYRQSAVMLLVHGPVEPEFIVAAIPDRNIGDRQAIITESDGCILKKVNDMPLMEYFSEVGILMRVGQDNTTIPLMVDYGDGSKPVAVAIYGLTPENWAICGGEMPAGATFFCGEIDNEGIVESAREGLEKVLGLKGKNGLLMLPCVTRYIMLTPNQDAEMKLAEEMVGGKIPYVLALSGGELCPVKGGDGKWRNRHHNYTFSACLF